VRQIKSIKRCLLAQDHSGHCPCTQSARLYCNVVFCWSPQLRHSVLNMAVRLVAGASRCNHFTRLLRHHHWLPIKQRTEHKLCMTVHRCLHGEAPRYVADLITPSAAATTRAGLRSATCGFVAVPRTTSSLGCRSFAVADRRAQNNLPSLVRRTPSVDTFKCQLIFLCPCCFYF